MKCEICGKTTFINYGNANTIICEDCIRTDEAKIKIYSTVFQFTKKPDDVINGLSVLSKLLILFGYSIVLIGILLFLRIVENHIIFLFDRFVIGILVSTFGLIVVTLGYLVPYIVMIEKNTRKNQDN